jgi:hypothetical protein
MTTIGRHLTGNAFWHDSGSGGAANSASALQFKLDELIRVNNAARDLLMGV